MAEGPLTVVIRPVVNSPALSERIGYLASQQRRAYNAAVGWLNREPGLALRVSAVKGATAERSLCGRITLLRKADPSWGDARTPRRVHDAGARLAFMAQERLASAHSARVNEIRRIENDRHNWAANPPRTPAQWRALRRQESRYQRLSRHHRRTLAFRTRKTGTQTLEMDNNQGFSVSDDRMSIWLGGRRDGIRVPLRHPLPADAVAKAFRLVEKRRGRMGVRNRSLASVEYEAHVSVQYLEAVPELQPTALPEIVGVQVRKYWATSDGAVYHNDGPHRCNCPAPQPRVNGRPGRFRHSGRCGFARPRQLQERIIAKPGGTRRRRASKRRQRLERRRRELLRIQTADRNRVFTAHAQDMLDKRPDPVKMVAVERWDRRNMMATARGGTGARGQDVRLKSRFNRVMSEAATGVTMAILVREAGKRGIPVVQVNPRDSSLTCSNCGNVNEKPRKNQARFECGACGWSGSSDANACAVLAFRAYQQQVDPAAAHGPPTTGGWEQPSLPHVPGFPSWEDVAIAQYATLEAAARGLGQGAEQKGGGQGQP